MLHERSGTTRRLPYGNGGEPVSRFAAIALNRSFHRCDPNQLLETVSRVCCQAAHAA